MHYTSLMIGNELIEMQRAVFVFHSNVLFSYSVNLLVETLTIYLDIAVFAIIVQFELQINKKKLQTIRLRAAMSRIHHIDYAPGFDGRLLLSN